MWRRLSERLTFDMVYWSALILVLANLAPLYGVTFLGWSLTMLMLLYWSESGIIAFFTVLKLIQVKDNPKLLKLNPNVPTSTVEASSKWAKVLFFIVHFGLFMLGHLIFIFVLFFNPASLAGDPFVLGQQFLLNFGCLFVAHAFSYGMNFLLKKEYKRAKVDGLLWSAYQRVIFMHLVIMGCGFLSFVAFTNTPVVFMAFAVLLKLVADLHAHFKTHRLIER